MLRLLLPVAAVGAAILVMLSGVGHGTRASLGASGERPLTKMTALTPVTQDYDIPANSYHSFVPLDLARPAGQNWTIDLGVAIYGGSDTTQYVYFVANLTDSSNTVTVAKFGKSMYNWVCNYCFQQIPLSASLGGKPILTVYVANEDSQAQEFEVKATPFYWS
jgi:hypothetical protein